MRTRIMICLLAFLCCIGAFSPSAQADTSWLYTDEWSYISGDPGPSLIWKGGNYAAGGYPVNLYYPNDQNYVLGAPDDLFVSLPTGSSIIVDFAIDFGAVPIKITEVGLDGASAEVWLYPVNPASPLYVGTITRDSFTPRQDIIVDLNQPFIISYMNAHGGAFDQIELRGFDEAGASPGFDLDAIAVDPEILGTGRQGSPTQTPEPATLFLLGAGFVGLVGFHRQRKN